MNLKNTKAFGLYVDDKFISKLNSKESISIDEEEAESLIQNAICKYLITKIKPMLKDFSATKKEYLSKVKTVSPELSYDEAKNAYLALEEKLKSQHKLHFCIDEIAQDFYEIDSAKILFFIYAKLLNNKNPEKYKYIKDKYQYSRIYKYLKLASLELTQFNIDEYFTYDLEDLINELFYVIVTYNYANDDFSLVPLLDLDLNKLKSLQADSDEEIDMSALLDMAEDCLKEKLINEMHKIDNERTF